MTKRGIRKECMNKKAIFLLNLIFLITASHSIRTMEITNQNNTPTIEILDSEIPEEIMQHIIVSHVMQCLHTNPNKPDISLLTTTAQLNKKWAASMLELHKQIIEQGAQLLNKTHYCYIKDNLKTPNAKAISVFNENKLDMRLANCKIIAAVSHPYCIVNYIDIVDDSHLRNACLYTKPVIVEKLLKMGAIITAQDFVLTARCSHLDQKDGIACAKLLLQQDCDLINAHYESETALHWSAIKGNNLIAHFLIEDKADVNIANGYGFTPLHKTIQNVFDNNQNLTLKTVQLLIAAGANPFKKINCGEHTDCDAYDLVKKLHTKDNSLTPFGKQLVKELRKYRAMERSQGTAHYMGTVSTVDKNT